MVESYGLGIFSGRTWQNGKRKGKINLSVVRYFSYEKQLRIFKIIMAPLLTTAALFPQCRQVNDSTDDSSSASLLNCSD